MHKPWRPAARLAEIRALRIEKQARKIEEKSAVLVHSAGHSDGHWSGKCDADADADADGDSDGAMAMGM